MVKVNRANKIEHRVDLQIYHKKQKIKYYDSNVSGYFNSHKCRENKETLKIRHSNKTLGPLVQISSIHRNLAL